MVGLFCHPDMTFAVYHGHKAIKLIQNLVHCIGLLKSEHIYVISLLFYFLESEEGQEVVNQLLQDALEGDDDEDIELRFTGR